MSLKDSLCYSDSICVDSKSNKASLQEQWSIDCEMLDEASTDT